MRVRCTATADYRSNAVGELEIECSAEGLRIALLGVSSYREGYAPGPPVEASAVCVPWPAVYATRLGERQLQLSVDARNLPLNRFLLVDFVERLPDTDGGAARLPYVLAGSALVALGTGLWLARALPHARAFGTLGWAVLAVAVVLLVIAWRSRTAPRTPPNVVLDQLCHDLARHVPHHISSAAPTPPPRSLEPVALASLLPRSAIAIAITLAAATLAALIGGGAARPRPTSPEPAAVGPSSLAAGAAPFAGAPPGSALDPGQSPVGTGALASDPGAGSASTPGTPANLALDGRTPLGACTCARHESLAWQAPLARVSPIILGHVTRLHDGHEHSELELALVNDGASEVRQLKVSVLFFEPRSGERSGSWQTGERSLFAAGPLAPGEAIRWHVEGRGTSVDVIAPDLGTLAADGSDAAPREAYARLSTSSDRALRLHAVRMLAFLGDARAASAGRALSSSASPAEADYLARLLEPARELGACALTVEHGSKPWRVSACMFNRSARTRSELGVRLRAFDAALDPRRPGAGAPALLGEHTAWLRASLPAHTGFRVELAAPLSLEPGSVPRAFELEVLQAKGDP